MSRSVDLFIDADIPIGELAAEVSRLTELSVVQRADSEEWILQEGEVTAWLAEHPYVDDGDLLLAHYRYALSCRVTSGIRLQAAPETALLRLVAESLQHRSEMPVLLVLDLQYRDSTNSVSQQAAGRADQDPSLAAPSLGAPNPVAAPPDGLVPAALEEGTA